VKDKGGKESNSTENEGAQRGVRVDEHIFRRWSEKFDLQKKKMIFTCISFYYR
jgi:transposase-like protein